MKSNYEERKSNRLQAFQNLAAKNENLSGLHFDAAHQISSFIPFGQPILVGHHSEKRHRRDLEKIDNGMRKAVEADKKAAYYKDRAENLLNGTAISSDDPKALDKLQEKLENLELQQELMKDCNKIIKKVKLNPAEKISELMKLGLSEPTATKLLSPDFCGRIGIPSYKLTNNNAVIRNTRERIEKLEKIAAMEDSEEEINGITLKVSTDDNRVQIFFPYIPSEDVRKQLKSYGFHWTPSIGAWQRQISNHAIYYAKEVLKGIK
ncbi:MAG: DUF3560 domain-containing protein [Segetibacter sp.]